MKTLCLGVGPSAISDDVVRDIQEIATSGLLSESHRGPVVRGELKGAVAALRSAMGIPAEYTVLFQPSATAAMEMILRNTVHSRSFHFVDGAFSGRFADIAQEIGLEASVHAPAWELPATPWEATIPEGVELISLAHNETSIGRMWPWAEIERVRDAHPDALLSIDVTSTFGAMAMDWTLGDFWFFSVQKCLGLPAGLGMCLASPRAVARAEALGTKRGVAGWQDLPALAQRIKVGETVETPNVLDIALVRRQMERWDLATVEAGTRAKAAAVAETLPDAAFFIRDPVWRSLTAHNLLVDDPADLHARAAAAGISIGAGYGPLKDSCVRMATFPSVTVEQVRGALALFA